MELLKENIVSELDFGFQNIFSVRPKKIGIKKLREHVWSKLDPAQFYEFNPKNKEAVMLLPYYMNKGSVLEEMQKRMRIGCAETVVAGDGTNDLSMMAKAQFVVCPSNAAEEVKEFVRNAGGIVASKKYSDGVIEAAKRIIA